jgi:heat shock protein HslJ
MHARAHVYALVVLLVASSCSPAGLDQFHHGLSGQKFLITEVMNEVQDDSFTLLGEPTIEFSSGRFNANTGCNTISGQYARTSSGYRIRDVSSTLRGCLEEFAWQDESLRNALRSGARITVGESSIVVRSDDWTVIGIRTSDA